ncbi:MAG: hypothetical protein L0H29_00955 [Sinobacteraceae bacterium]|nr:hypothetical protein [Nevskiaceae bacterium]
MSASNDTRDTQDTQDTQEERQLREFWLCAGKVFYTPDAIARDPDTTESMMAGAVIHVREVLHD